MNEQIEHGTFLRMPDSFIEMDSVILPPDERGSLVKGSEVGMRETSPVPRSRYLVEALSEQGLHYNMASGTPSQESMRKSDYLMFYLPDAKKLILVNDEASQATFVVHDIESKMEDWQKVYSLTKSQLKDSQEYRIDTVMYLGDPDKWKQKITELILNVEQPEKKYSEYEKAPEDWKTNRALVDELGRSFEKVKNLAEPFRIEHPDWFKIYLNKIGQPNEHYSPEFVEAIRESSKKITHPPEREGWQVISSIAQELSVPEKKVWHKRVQRIAQKFRSTHPEWFRIFLDKAEKPMEHYRRELVEKIKEELDRGEKT
ncbi:MAG: hypothetical protein ABI643_03070 [Candidatus Doudnabacteria bacterium]